MKNDGLTITAEIADTELFDDIVALLKDLAQDNPEIENRIMEICEKHKTIFYMPHILRAKIDNHTSTHGNIYHGTEY